MNLDNSLYSVEPCGFDKELCVPGSKSFANRALILAATTKKKVLIKNLPLSHDVEKMLEIFQYIGLDITHIEDGVTISNSFPECEKEIERPLIIRPGDGGTTTRFIIGLLSKGEREYIIEPEGRMRTRPINGLVDCLKELGVKCSQSNDKWLSLQGPFKNLPSSIEVDASKTTQHATSLALSLTGVDVTPVGMDFSKSYWNMTLDLISRFKNGCIEFTVPVDFSSLGYPLALSAVMGRVKVLNCLTVDKFQSDSIFLEILADFGAKVMMTKEGLIVEKGDRFIPINHDCSDCPDLVPTIAFLCSFANGESYLSNVRVLRYKESDRLEELFSIFKKFGIDYTYSEEKDLLRISGTNKKLDQRININTAEDHRMVMISYLFLRANGGGSVNHSSCVSKSFGNFFSVMES